MQKIALRGMLFDFYGELLTDRQRQVYGDVIENDLSLAEAAQAHGISRQGVHDLLKRCDRQLEEYESKLCLYEKFKKNEGIIEEIRQEVEALGTMEGDISKDISKVKVKDLVKNINEALNNLRGNL